MSTTTVAPRTKPLKVAMASFIGTGIEYYDFFIYGTAAALVFPKLFFPEQSPLMATLLSFATFGVGFFARPVGGVVFGHFGDRIGRKKMLVISLMGMGAATFCMGLLPGYATIGILAPILLTVLRILQGFCVGGEWGGATLMAVEHAPVGKRGLYGAFPQMGAPAGTALATVAFLTVAQLPDEQFLSWGWRIPFLLSAALVVVGLFIRLTIGESPEFVAVHEHKEEVKLPIKVAFQKYWRQILLVAGIYFSQGIFAYICISYFVSYATAVVKLDRTSALLGVFVAGIVAVFLYGFFGSLSDRIGRKTTYMIGAVAMAVSIWPAVALINTGNPWLFAARHRAGLRCRDGPGRRRHRIAVLADVRRRGPLHRGLRRLHPLPDHRVGVRPADRGRPLRRDRQHQRPGHLPAGRLRGLDHLAAPAARPLGPQGSRQATRIRAGTRRSHRRRPRHS